jgi:thiol-disulfide isomerase/thioredoxin
MLAALALSAFVWPALAAAALDGRATGPEVPDLEATSLDGGRFSLRRALADHKAVVVVFLSTVCPYANRFAPHLQDLNAAYGPRGVLFVGVNSNNWEPRDEVAEHARDHFGFLMIKDEGHVLADRLEADRTPEAYLFDAQGALRYRGWVKSKQDSPDLERAIEAVLHGRPVPKARTKAFGCAVDRFR